MNLIFRFICRTKRPSDACHRRQLQFHGGRRVRQRASVDFSGGTKKRLINRNILFKSWLCCSLAIQMRSSPTELTNSERAGQEEVYCREEKKNPKIDSSYYWFWLRSKIDIRWISIRYLLIDEYDMSFFFAMFYLCCAVLCCVTAGVIGVFVAVISPSLRSSFVIHGTKSDLLLDACVKRRWLLSLSK